MPFGSHFHREQENKHSPSLAQGLYEATHTLGSFAAPSGNLHTASSGTTTAGTDAFLPQFEPQSQSQAQARYSAQPLQQPHQHSQSNIYSEQPELAHRPHPAARMSDDLQLPLASKSIGAEYSQSSNNNPHQSVPPGSLYGAPPPSNSVPGSLQPGLAGRPAPIQSAYTAPTTVPQVPHISTNAQQYTLPTRSNTMHNASHSYSRSSPAGLEQKYIPFNNNNPEGQKYPQTPQQQPPKFYAPQTPTGGSSNSPLALDQIRPRANSNFGGDDMSGTTVFGDTAERAPTNSNYVSPWAVFAFDWCKYPVPNGNSAGKIAVGSYLEDPHNYITILDTQIVPQEVTTPGAPSYSLEYNRVAEATCAYPVTRILWEPPIAQKQSTDLLATSGDHLRLWSLPHSAGPNVTSTITRSSSVNQRDPATPKLTPLALLSNSKTPEHTAPLTSLDWNTLSPKLIITSSIDTTCTIWDIPTLTAKTQLIAHDKEVFDVRFCAGSVDVFVSCGADGSVRMFDLRSLEHSTIIYEPAEKKPDGDKGNTPPHPRMSPTRAQQTLHPSPPLLRLAASPHDSHLLATFAADSNLIRILDVRQPGQALLELHGHASNVNAVEWSPGRRGMLASGGDDSLVLVWDLLHSHNGAVINGDVGSGNGFGGSSQVPAPVPTQVPGAPPGAPAAAPAPNINLKGPAASWRCDYEIANLSWAPQSGLTGQGGEWVGVAGGRGVWGVKL